MNFILGIEGGGYWWGRSSNYFKKESVLLKADPDQDFVWSNKAALTLYTLTDLIGEQNMNMALREFRDSFAFRDKPPYPGANDLYRILQKHIPDSAKYFLTDSWERIAVYDNKMVETKSTQMGKTDEYRVHLKINVGKTYTDSSGKESNAADMNDYIDIGVFGESFKNREGRTVINPLHFEKYKLTAGVHTIDIVVKGKPVHAGIDPYGKLIDKSREDNNKEF